VELELKECDMVLGTVVRARTIATLAFQIHLERITTEPVNAQQFHLRSHDGTMLEDVLVTLSVSVMEEQDSDFWRIFERHEVNLKTRAALEGFNEEQTIVATSIVLLSLLLNRYILIVLHFQCYNTLSPSIYRLTCCFMSSCALFTGLLSTFALC
jgi:hypothetical protein